MGYLSALGWAETAEWAGLETALAGHFGSNCYPPIPGCMVPVAKEALALTQKGQQDAKVDVGQVGVSHRVYGAQVPVGTLIKELHLEAFVEMGLGVDEELELELTVSKNGSGSGH